MNDSSHLPVVNAYKVIRSKQNAERKKLREECLDSVSEFCSTALFDVRKGVNKVYTNQKQIKNATLQLQRSANKFNGKMEQWIDKYNSLNFSLRGLGDIRNWAIAMKTDLQEISESLEEIVEYKKQKQRNLMKIYNQSLQKNIQQ